MFGLCILSQHFVVAHRRPSLSVLSVLIAPVSLLFLLFVPRARLSVCMATIVGVCCRECLPATQLLQVDELVAPVLDEYLPESIVVSEVKK